MVDPCKTQVEFPDEGIAVEDELALVDADKLHLLSEASALALCSGGGFRPGDGD